MGNKKITDEVIVGAYEILKSVWRVGDHVGLCGQSVHERLVKLGKIKRINKFTKKDDEELKLVYKKFSKAGKLSELSIKFGRTKNFLCRQAKRLGLTDKNIKRPYSSEGSSIRIKKWLSENEHPRGALGIKHSIKTRNILSRKSKAGWKRRTPEQLDDASKRASMLAQKVNTRRGREGASWKCGWRNIGGVKKYYRSRWEANYGFYLEWLKNNGKVKSWKHEPKTFWFEGIKRGCLSYLPDFCVQFPDGHEEYHEVKGWMDARSVTKIKRMAKYFPEVTLIVIDSKGYKELSRHVSMIVPGWES